MFRPEFIYRFMEILDAKRMGVLWDPEPAATKL
jgi:hypothetical protein